MKKLIAVGTTTALLILGAAACSDDSDDSAKSTETTEAAPTSTADTSSPDEGSTPEDPELAAYCEEMGAAGGEEPDFNGFFEEHPEPTLADWSEFLPGVIEGTTTTLTAIEAVSPTESISDLHTDVVEALTAVRDLFQESLDAAESGDQATFDALEEQNQGELSPALEEAIGAVTDACGVPQG